MVSVTGAVPSCCGRPKCGARRRRAVVCVDQYGAACGARHQDLPRSPRALRSRQIAASLGPRSERCSERCRERSAGRRRAWRRAQRDARPRAHSSACPLHRPVLWRRRTQRPRQSRWVCARLPCSAPLPMPCAHAAAAAAAAARPCRAALGTARSRELGGQGGLADAGAARHSASSRGDSVARVGDSVARVAARASRSGGNTPVGARLASRPWWLRCPAAPHLVQLTKPPPQLVHRSAQRPVGPEAVSSEAVSQRPVGPEAVSSEAVRRLPRYHTESHAQSHTESHTQMESHTEMESHTCSSRWTGRASMGF